MAPTGTQPARRGLREEAGLHAGRSPPPALTRGLWLSGGWTQLRARRGFPGLESAPECRRPPGMGSRFPGGCGSGGGCLRRAEVRRGGDRSSAAAGAPMGTLRQDTWGPRARRRTPGAPLSGVWLGVPWGLRLQFSFRFLHLLGEKGDRRSFWISPKTLSLPTSLTTRGPPSRPAHPKHSSLSGTACTLFHPTLPPLRIHGLSFSRSKSYPVLLNPFP